MELKKINKINEQLAGDFNLVPLLDNDWVLYRMDKTERIILNSNKNTKEELIKFVKEHKSYNIVDFIQKEILIINAFTLLLCVCNLLFIRSELISGMVGGMLIVLLPLLITIFAILEKNYNVRKKIKAEDFEAYNQAISKAIAKALNVFEKVDKSHTKRKTSSTKTPRKKASVKGEEKKD